MNLDPTVTKRIRASRLGTDQTVAVDSTRAILLVLAVYVGSLLMMALARVLPDILTAPVIVLSLSFLPGTLLLVALGRNYQSISAEHVLYAFGSSLVLLMFVGALANILLPFVGVARPLMPNPLVGSITAMVSLLAIVAGWRNSSGTITLRVPALWSPSPLALLLLPLLSVIGVLLLNVTGSNALLLPVLVVISVVPLVAVWRLDEQWYSLAVWTMALAILYHKSLWKYSGFGGRPHGIAAWEAGRWSPGVTSIEPYASELVQNGVLFPLFARLSDLFIMTQYEVVNPFFVSFIPLALYVAFRRYVRADIAFLGATLFMFVHPFYLQYPTAGRAATPVLFLALFGVVLSNDGLPSGSRAALGVSFLTGLVITHYATSYYVAAAFVVVLVILSVLRAVDELQDTRLRRTTTTPKRGVSVGKRTGHTARSTIFSASTVFFFISAAFGWYLYTRGGWKFDLLPKHVYQNLQTLLSGSATEGRTTARIQESYTSLSIEISKYLYILVALLIAIGIATIYYRRIFADDRSFDDSYLAIGTALFGIFGTTTILHNWGGGRPMMITFSFTTVFAVLGAVRVTNGVGNIAAASAKYLPKGENAEEKIRKPISDERIGAYAFGVLLMGFLLLNTGVAAATVFGGLAPSNVPAESSLATNDAPQSQVTVHRGTDIVTHVWLVEHLDSDYTVYGDTYGARQFDWYRPDVAARTATVGGGYTSATKPEVFNTERQREGAQPGYILIMGHNLALEAVWRGKFTRAEPLETLALDERNRIYTTGKSHIYFYSAQTRSSPPESHLPDDE